MTIDQTTVEVKVREATEGIILDIEALNFTYPQTVALKNAVTELVDKGHRYFAFNCSDIQVVDSYGLATIVSTLKIIKDNHGALVLYGLNDFFVKLVDMTHLDRVLEVWDSEPQALYYLQTLKK